MEYSHIGNIREDYQHEPRDVRSRGVVTTPRLALKFYSMMKPSTSSATIRETVDAAQRLLKTEIKYGKIAPEVGMGFAILSEDMLNVARWDSKHPIVLKNYIYEYEKGDVLTATPTYAGEIGSFCIWELCIVQHERDAWKRYLVSEHEEEDKKRYLEDCFEGTL